MIRPPAPAWAGHPLQLGPGRASCDTLSDLAGHARGGGAVRQHDRPGLAQQRLLDRQALWVLLGAADEGKHGEAAAALGAGRLRLSDRRGEHTGGVVMAGVAEDDVEHDHRRRGIVRLLHDPFDARGRVDHRVRPADGELVVAEIEREVPGPAGERSALVQRRVGVHAQAQAAPDELGLGAEGAARVQPAHETLAGREPLRLRIDEAGRLLGLRRGNEGPVLQQRDGCGSGVAQGRHLDNVHG
jgi:hypothetical protein